MLYSPLSQRLELGYLFTIDEWCTFLFDALDASAGGHPMQVNILKQKVEMDLANDIGEGDYAHFKQVLLELAHGRLVRKEADEGESRL
jgi:hypothetical protein